MNTTPTPTKIAGAQAEVKAMAEDAVKTARKSGREALRAVAQTASDVGDDLEEAAAKGRGAAEDLLAEGTRRVSDTLRSTADALRDGSLPRSVVAAVSDRVDGAVDALSGKSVAGLVADVQQLARRNPGAFMIGAAVAGFALARVLRSSSERDRTRGEDWS